jgi:hypothetical protein
MNIFQSCVNCSDQVNKNKNNSKNLPQSSQSKVHYMQTSMLIESMNPEMIENIEEVKEAKEVKEVKEVKESDLNVEEPEIEVTEDDLEFARLRAERLSKSWEDGAVELEKVNLLIQDLLQQKRKPEEEYFDDEYQKIRKEARYTDDEFFELGILSASEVSVHVLLNSMKNMVSYLRGPDDYFRCIAIVSSAEMQDELDGLLQELKERHIDADLKKLELINAEVQKEVEDVREFKIIE